MGWALLYLEALLAFALLFLMGASILVAAGSKNVKRIIVASLLVSLAFFGVLSFASSEFTWSLLSVFVSFALLFAIVAVLRVFAMRSSGSLSFREQRQTFVEQVKTLFGTKEVIGAALGVFAASLLSAVVMSGLSLSSPIGLNGYDNPFHYSVVRHILETGNASAVGAGSVMGSSQAIYPDLWHSLTALLVLAFGQTIVIAGWTTCLVFVGFIAPLGIAVLMLTIFKTYAAELAFVTPVVALLVPYSLLRFISFGSLFANLAGFALLPLAIALFVGLANEHCQVKKAGKAHKALCVSMMGGILVSILVLGFAHPSTVIVFCLTIAPFVIAKAPKLVFKLGAGVSFAAAWIFMQTTPLFFRTVNCLDRVAYDIECGAGLFEKAGLDYSSFASLEWFPIAVFVALCFISSFIAYMLRNKWRYSCYLVSIALVLGIAFSSCFPTNWFSVMVSGYFYRDVVRLTVLANLLMLPLYTAVPALLLRFINVRFAGVTAMRSTLVLVFVITCVGCVAYLANNLTETKESFMLRTTSQALASAQVEYLENVSFIVGDDVVLNNDNDDTRWLYPVYGSNALLKGNPANQMSSMDEDYCALIENIAAYGLNNEAGEKAREAAKKLGVKYVTKMTNRSIYTMPFNEFSQIVYTDNDSICEVTEQTPGFELVYELEGMQLFKLSE